MKEIYLKELNLKTFTEQDASDYCQINNLYPDNITKLDFSWNKLTDISGIKIFKNTERIYLYNNQIADISVLKYLNNLKTLVLNDNNKIKDISVISNLNKLENLDLSYNNEIKDISVIKDLNKLKILHIDNLELKSDQIQYIKSLKNLHRLWCRKGFKDMKVLNKIYKNIEIYD